jgi:CRISPR-associated endonuclease Csn1
MIERILGIDLGIASLGWAVIEHDANNDENNKIVDCGVRLFTAAETPKEKESPNKARREARGIRRVIKRRRVRMNEIKKLCISNGLLTERAFDLDDGIYNSKANRTDVWKLRHDALHRLLNGNELARVMIHIAKHRGFKFIGDDESDEESGKVKQAGAQLREKFYNAGCLSVGEWLWRERGEHGKKRNKSGDYEISIPRDFLVQEIETIFASQSKFGNTLATDALINEYKNIAFFVRPMQSIEKMVGSCTYFPDEKRAPKSSPTAERFVALGKFYNTVVVDNEGNERKIIEIKSTDELMAFATSKEKIDYKQLRKFLELNEHQIFKGLTYKGKPKKAKKGEVETPNEWEFDKAEAEKKVWLTLKGHSAFKTALGDEKFSNFIANIDLADDVAKTLTYYKDERQKREKLSNLKLDADAIEALCKIGFTDFVQLSLKALKIILPEMENGKRYDEAIGILGKPTNEKSIYLPPLKDTDIDILNPTVIRAFAQFRKVANALVKKYGSFDKVHFELAREVNTKADIKGMIEGQRKNEKEREAAKVWITENFGNSVPLTRKNILKKRLYEQQSEICPYTGEHIKLERLFDEGYCEIDHILPRSRSADDSMANKVLVMSKANQDKTNRTPYEWFGHDAHAWERYEARINTTTNRSKMGMGKINRLLKKNFDENSEKEFLSRNLNDTRYMARAIKTYCENYWKLAHEDDKLRIQIRSGKLTSELRSRWIEGYLKDRSIHTHHALDAIVIAFATQSMVQKLSTYYGAKETRREKEKPIFKAPMEHIRDAVEKALTLDQQFTISAKDGREIILNRLLISRPPRASVTGAAHKETIQSPSDYKGRGVAVNSGKGMCDNGDMPRVDVFTKEGKYYLVPIYVADFAKEELPNKAIVQGKGKEWIEMDDSYSFLFSLHKEDLVQIQLKNEEPFIGYFKGAHSGTAQVQVQAIDSDYLKIAGSKTALIFKKYTIDPLGYYHEVKGEKRLGTIPQEAKKRRG